VKTLYYALRGAIRDRYAAWKRERQLRRMTTEQLALGHSFRACCYACNSDCQELKEASSRVWNEFSGELIRRYGRP
jgi:hypothetical protein